jgi:hypothetical protein
MADRFDPGVNLHARIECAEHARMEYLRNHVSTGGISAR